MNNPHTSTSTNTNTSACASSVYCTLNDDDEFDDSNDSWKRVHEENYNNSTSSSSTTTTSMPEECRRRLTLAVQKIADWTEPETQGLLLSGGIDSCAILEAAASQGITFAFAITVVIIADNENENDNDNDNPAPPPPDELYAKFAAAAAAAKQQQQHNCLMNHVIVKLTPTELLDQQLSKTIQTLAVWGTMDTRNSLVIGAALEKAKELGLKDIVVGDGADELFGGYSFMFGSGSSSKEEEEQWKKRRDRMVRQWTFVTGTLAKSFGVVVHQPFMDREVLVDWALQNTHRHDCVADDYHYDYDYAVDNNKNNNNNNKIKIQSVFDGPYHHQQQQPQPNNNNDNDNDNNTSTTTAVIGKLLLRQAFSSMCRSAWRPWNAIDVGSGAIVIGTDDYWTNNSNSNSNNNDNDDDDDDQKTKTKISRNRQQQQHHQEYNVTDAEFLTAKIRLREDHGIVITSKEHLVNIRMYQKIFCSNVNNKNVDGNGTVDGNGNVNIDVDLRVPALDASFSSPFSFSSFVHPTKQRYPIGDKRGCVGCCFEIGEVQFCHVCDAYPAQHPS